MNFNLSEAARPARKAAAAAAHEATICWPVSIIIADRPPTISTTGTDNTEAAAPRHRNTRADAPVGRPLELRRRAMDFTRGKSVATPRSMRGVDGGRRAYRGRIRRSFLEKSAGNRESFSHRRCCVLTETRAREGSTWGSVPIRGQTLGALSPKGLPRLD